MWRSSCLTTSLLVFRGSNRETLNLKSHFFAKTVNTSFLFSAHRWPGSTPRYVNFCRNFHRAKFQQIDPESTGRPTYLSNARRPEVEILLAQCVEVLQWKGGAEVRPDASFGSFRVGPVFGSKTP